MASSETPEDVVRAAVEAGAAGRLGELFEMLDPEDLTRWRRVTISTLEHYAREPDAERLLAAWGIREPAEAESLPDQALFVRWMNASALATRARLASDSTAPPPPPPVRRTVLGSVREATDLAHVVYREIVGSGSALRIVTLRRSVYGWKLRVDHDLLGLGSFHFGPGQPA